MGTCTGATPPCQDFVHSLSQNQRRSRLIDGYVHSAELDIKKAIPVDVKSMLKMYLLLLQDIKSQTEIDAAERIKQECV